MPLQRIPDLSKVKITTRFGEFEAMPVPADGFDKKSGRRRAEFLVSAANSIGGEPAAALNALIRRGPTLPFLEEINKAIGDVQQCSTLELDKKNRRFVWVPVEMHLSLQIITLLCLISVINAGLSNRIKRCARKGCTNFFFGDIRKKWCSDNCGSLIRVRNMRKRGRERQML